MENAYQNIDEKSLLFLQELLNTHGVSGYEYQTAKVIRRQMEQFVPAETDVLGNIVGSINGQNPFKVILTAHYDEIGFQIVYISEEGFLYFRRNGGIDKLSVPGSVVNINTSKGSVKGVIGKRPPHVQNSKEADKVLELDELWIDIGAGSKEEAERMVSVGDTATFEANYSPLLGSRIISKGLDDKIGVFIILEALRKLAQRNLQVGVYVVASVQEELGTRGITTSSYSISPSLGICVDVGISTDVPDIKKNKYGELKLGSGVGICHSADNNIKLVRMLQKTAGEKHISFQNSTAFLATGGTDTAKMQLTKGGVATALLSIPNRYMHSAVEMCDLQDADTAISIIVETIAGLSGKESFNPME